MLKTAFATALDIAEPVMVTVRPEHFKQPTPCEGWDVQALLQHMYNELAWVPELLAGKTVAQVGDSLDGDLVGTDIQGAWNRYSKTARQSAEATPVHHVVHLSYGNTPASAYLDEMAVELTVHTWDLAQAIQVPFHIPEEFAKALYLLNQSRVDGWRGKGLVGPEVKVPEDAPNEMKLLGLFGRMPR
ncbi:MAG TPA: TIGR03086 family metal-binding protein [Bacillota bacterium]|nr:TIGR03086 family metal-binding protein [Bacillota bacterium]